jgi:hypothetical protein
VGKSIVRVAGGIRCGYQVLCAQEKQMKFDGNLAWKQASAQVSANRDVLIALAGVFFLLPSLALGLLMPQPVSQTGMTPQQMLAVLQGYYIRALPVIVPVLLLQAVGTLAMLTLFTDRQRPTVGESIRRGAIGVVSYLASQILLGVAFVVVGTATAALAGLTGSMPAIVIAIAAFAVLSVYVWLRLSLTAPVIAVESVRNPVRALLRSWGLTTGNSGRIILFYLLVGIAFAVIVAIVTMLVGIAISLVAKGQPAAVVQEIVNALLSAVLSSYAAAVLAAVHRQVAGPSADAHAATFE